MKKTLFLVALVALVPSVVLGQNCLSCQDTAGGGSCSTLSGITSITCPAGANGCYREEFSDGRVNRGCASSLSAADLATCTAGTTGCKICQGDLCNEKKDFQRCHRCDSVAESCPQLQSATENTYECSEYLDECAVQIVGQATVRGCRQELNLPETCSARTCTTCTENFCNGIVFPNNRHQCHICTGAIDACFGQMAGTDSLRVCDNYVPVNDQCYYVLTGQRQIFRGCTSTADEGLTACNSGRCQRCFASGCNSPAVINSPQLSCIQCPANDPACAWGFSASQATICVNPVYLGETESCFQRSNVNGGAQRGCSLDSDVTCDADDEFCTSCRNNGCNRVTYQAHSCYQCRSSNDPNCRDPLKASLAPSACPSLEQSLANQGCYVLEQDNGQVVRGCLHGLDSRLLAECSAGDRCEVCTLPNCNDQPFGGDASALKAISMTLLALVAVFVHMV